MEENKLFYNADDISSMLAVSRPTAYRIIRNLNDELVTKGYITVSGRVPKKYFEEKFYCWANINDSSGREKLRLYREVHSILEKYGIESFSGNIDVECDDVVNCKCTCTCCVISSITYDAFKDRV